MYDFVWHRLFEIKSQIYTLCASVYDNVPLSVPIFIFVMVILGVAELGNSLFVIGGNDGTSFLNSCEHYDPLTNRWSYVPPMSRPRAGIGAAVVDGILYVAGMSNHNTIVRYNIQTFQVSRNYREIPTFLFAFTHHT